MSNFLMFISPEQYERLKRDPNWKNIPKEERSFMMTEIRQIPLVRERFPRAIGHRIDSKHGKEYSAPALQGMTHGYFVLSEPSGIVIGVGRKKREAWQKAWSYVQRLPVDELKVIPIGGSGGIYQCGKYQIRVAKASGGKAGTGKNRTSTLQITSRVKGGFLVKKSFTFFIGNKQSYDRAEAKCVEWIKKNPVDPLLGT